MDTLEPNSIIILSLERIGLPTLFFPMQRVERIALDEPHGSIPSMAGRFEQRVGRSLRDYLALFV